MSQENVEIVRRLLDALNLGDREMAVAFADPEIVIDATRHVINPGTYAGIDGLRQMLAGMDEVWEEMRMEPTEFIDGEDRVVVIGRLVGKGKGSGVEVDRPNAQIWTLRDGRVMRLAYGFTNRTEALEAAGLLE